MKLSEDELAVVNEARAAAALLISEHWPSKPREPSQITEKGPWDFQTDLDLIVEERIVSMIKQRFPQDEIIAEESGLNEGASGSTWYIDPLDGTTNLIAGRSEIAVSIARFRKGNPLIAAIFLPCRKIEVLSDGSGDVFVNGEKWTQHPPPERLKEAIVGFSSLVGNKELAEEARGGLLELWRRARGIRISGALAYELAQVALGELDARFSPAAKAVDVAAGAALVMKMGGVVTDMRGMPWQVSSKGILAARTEVLHRQVLEIISCIQ